MQNIRCTWASCLEGSAASMHIGPLLQSRKRRAVRRGNGSETRESATNVLRGR